MTPTRGILILGFGNPARGDDGLGPAFARAIENQALPGISTIWNYQPSVENAADIAEHATVIFVDATTSGPAPYSFRRIHPRATSDFSTHILPPESVLALACDSLGWRGSAYLLALRGYSFESFKEQLTPQGDAHLRTAVEHVATALTLDRLDSLLTDPPTEHSDSPGEPCQTSHT